MARYIDVDKAIESINRILIEKENEKSSTAYFAFEKFKELLETAPTADVVPTSELDRVMREKTTLECIVGTARNIARADTVKKMRHKIITQIQSCRQMRLLPSFGLFYQIITETTEELLKTPEEQ